MTAIRKRLGPPQSDSAVVPRLTQNIDQPRSPSREGVYSSATTMHGPDAHVTVVHKDQLVNAVYPGNGYEQSWQRMSYPGEYREGLGHVTPGSPARVHSPFGPNQLTTDFVPAQMSQVSYDRHGFQVRSPIARIGGELASVPMLATGEGYESPPVRRKG